MKLDLMRTATGGNFTFATKHMMVFGSNLRAPPSGHFCFSLVTDDLHKDGPLHTRWAPSPVINGE